MYETKTLLPAFEITVPKCMYTMKSLALKRAGSGSSSEVSGPGWNCSSTSSSSQSPQQPSDTILQSIRRQIDMVLKTENSSAMTKLEKRQEEVIKQLHDLRNQLQSMRSSLNLCGKTIEHTRMSCPASATYDSIPDIVINAHPKFIPYALLAIKNIWKDVFNLDVKCYSHSTISTLDKDALEFQNQLTAPTTPMNGPGIKITLIWKNTEHTEMISSPTMYVPIYGEVNIIRYLARVGPPSFRYEETEHVNNIDVILDICYQLLRCPNAKAMQPLLSALSDRLQQHKYFTGNELSIADVAVCSSIRRMPTAAKILPDNIRKWLVRAKEVTLI